jgi:hypothetical protein
MSLVPQPRCRPTGTDSGATLMKRDLGHGMRVSRSFPGTPTLRRRLKSYFTQCHRIHCAYEKALDENRSARLADGCVLIPPPPPWPVMPPYPEECRGMTCAARTRRGTSCRQVAIYANGRCKFHGGLSTGPRTVEGKRRSALNGFRPKRKKRTP